MGKALSILLLSSTKYLIGIILAVTSIEESTIISNYLFNIVGGLLGIVFFVYFGAFMNSLLKRILPVQKLRRFSWKNRFIVKVRKSFGVPGIAFITPVFLSIPLGVFVALSITNNKKQILIWTLAACVFWSSIFFIANYFFGITLPF